MDVIQGYTRILQKMHTLKSLVGTGINVLIVHEVINQIL
jgi:hypothetical protein